MIIATNHIKKSFNEKEILLDINFHVEANDKVAIVGNNGVGKTTLFKIITGELMADSGDVTMAKNCTIGYLHQHMNINSENTVFIELLSVFEDIMKIEKRLEQMEQAIAKSGSMTLTLAYDTLRQQYENNKGYEYKSLVKGILKGLGFEESIYDKKVSTLSGGQKTRISLAKLLLQDPTLLLLDEPTNHLDIESIEWLEGFLRNYRGAVLIISHDRYFLDKVVNKVVHIEFGKSQIYNGNYDNFVIESAKHHEIAMREYANQQREINKQKEVIAKLRQFNREKSIRRANSREKALNKITPLNMPMIDDKPMNLILTPQIQSGNDVLSVRDVGMYFDTKLIFKNISFEIKKGDKIAIVGPNGVGKTTLFKLILEQLYTRLGEIHLGTNVHIGYYDQEHESLNSHNSIIEEIQQTYPTLTNGHIRNVLAAFLFMGDDVFKEIGTLSGGEKGRVALAKLMLSESNFLLLDEPTNHLDIMSKEILERAITTYEGTVLYISHDRYFINQTATKILDMSKLAMTVYLGDYDYFLEKKKELTLISAPVEVKAETSKSANKLDWQKNKEQQTQIKKLQTKLKNLEKSIEDAEKEVMDIDEMLCQPEYYSDFAKSKQLSTKKQSIEQTIAHYYVEWETIEHDLEQFK
ncbi:MAG: ABC transporter [Epulopiscium sp. Nele67-Bin004]|nr:MAG: ABC transporter [Epulopiscium sp. Nele67-Bin004]